MELLGVVSEYGLELRSMRFRFQHPKQAKQAKDRYIAFKTIHALILLYMPLKDHDRL